MPNSHGSTSARPASYSSRRSYAVRNVAATTSSAVSGPTRRAQNRSSVRACSSYQVVKVLTSTVWPEIPIQVTCPIQADGFPYLNGMRLVSLLPSATEIVYALGLGD